MRKCLYSEIPRLLNVHQGIFYRLDTRRHTFVFEPKNRQTFYTHQTFTRALINEHTSGITGIHLESLPAPGRLETWIAWGLARLGTAVECRERSVESFESGVLYAPEERSFDVGKSLRIAVSDRLCSAKEMDFSCPSMLFCALRERHCRAGTAGPAHRPAGRGLPRSGRRVCDRCAD